jgi:hypothetical protein
MLDDFVNNFAQCNLRALVHSLMEDEHLPILPIVQLRSAKKPASVIRKERRNGSKREREGSDWDDHGDLPLRRSALDI